MSAASPDAPEHEQGWKSEDALPPNSGRWRSHDQASTGASHCNDGWVQASTTKVQQDAECNQDRVGSGSSNWISNDLATTATATREEGRSFEDHSFNEPAENAHGSKYDAGDQLAARSQAQNAEYQNHDWKQSGQAKQKEPPPPPPGPPPPWAEELHSPADETETILRALTDLVETHDGTLPGTAFEELYKMDYRHRQIVKASGGPKKFVEFHGDRFTWVQDGVPGGSVKLVHGYPSDRDASSNWWSSRSPSLSSGIAIRWVEDVIAWQKDGVLLLSKTFGEIEAWRSSQEASSFKALIDSWGGLEAFVDAHPTHFSWVRGTNNQAKICKAGAPASKGGHTAGKKDCCALLVEVLKGHGGSILAAKVFKHVKDWAPGEFDRFKDEVNEAGGIKKYISWYADRFECKLASGPGTETVSLVRQYCEDVVAELLRWSGGVLLASRVLPELQSWKPEEHAFCKQRIEDAGGIKKFIQHFDKRFKWVLKEGPGTEAIQLLEDQVVDSEALLDALTELVEWHEGSILASRFFIDLKAWRPDSYDSYRKNIGKFGGLKEFASQHPERFKWVSDDEGKDSIALVKNENFASLKEALVQILEYANGSMLASQVHPTMKSWKPAKADWLRREVDHAGSLKKLLQRYPDEFEWKVDSDTGKQSVHLVTAKAPVVEPVKSDSALQYQ
eukprot:TRINITY_DN72470_c0_g1_i1.p1 TRINITY_DN72470_c0_g1~~TRINITY_DN72470_c0_g1_i1.p1  ORF type:complete len:734 (+),score=162.33 TRINITY_DN72470_c0_g1_i1:179-2203(+)